MCKSSMCKSSQSRILLLALGAVFVLTAMKSTEIKGLILGVAGESVEEVVIDRSFSVQPGELLRLDVGHADVSIETGGGAEARVRVVLEGRNMERARRFYEHLNFDVGYSGGEVIVRTNPRGSWNGSSGGANIDVFVTLPEVFDADVNMAHGDLRAGSLKGDLSFRIAHGDIAADTFSGATLALDAAHGDVHAERFLSEKIRLDIQHGDFEVDEVASTNLDISAAHGDIDIDALSGYPRVRTSHGDVEIRLVDMQGGEFRSDFGDIDLSTASSTAADLDIEASDADIASTLRFEGTQRDGAVRGRINGGGPKLTARTSHGDVNIRAD